jgi:hypothetical protein
MTGQNFDELGTDATNFTFVLSIFLQIFVFISVVNQGGLSFLIVIIRFGIALPASFISICTIERVIESISSYWIKSDTIYL